MTFRTFRAENTIEFSSLLKHGIALCNSKIEDSESNESNLCYLALFCKLMWYLCAHVKSTQRRRIIFGHLFVSGS
jgi:hypothetical protein